VRTRAAVLSMATSRAREYLLDPVLFAQKILGDDPWPVPIQIIRALEKPHITAAWSLSRRRSRPRRNLAWCLELRGRHYPRS
jgi:hypothetical protein